MAIRFLNWQQLPEVLVLVLGTVLSVLTAVLVRNAEQQELRDTAAQVASDRVEVLRGQLIRSMEVLYAIESLYATREEISRDEFRNFVKGALARQPELQALAWDPRVLREERATLEAMATSDGIDRFQFTEETAEGVLAPAGNRNEYFPVYFLESIEKNGPALGFDVGSEGRRRSALENARDSGRPTATPPVRLAQEPGSQEGFLVFVPVYSEQAQTTPARRANLRGFAVAVFRIGDLVDASLRTASDMGLNVSIVDQANEGSEIYRHDSGPAGPIPTWQTSIDVAGRKWMLTFQPTEAFVAQHGLWQPWAALGAGLVITGLVTTSVSNHTRRFAAIAQRVREATRDLSAEILERKRAEEALVAARDELEIRVRERTAELGASNEALVAEIAIRKHAEAAAQAASRAKSEFLANMSHEIRTPLNAILGYSQILLRDSALGPFHRDALLTIASSSDHLLRLINEILDLSKIDAGRMEVAISEFDLAAVATDLTSMFQPPCEEKQLGLRVEGLNTRRHTLVRGDEGKLRQILINLLGNAIRFTERGCITMRFLRLDSDVWRFEVEDTGVGIPPAMSSVIFEPFQQGPNASGRGGTGLGLTIARRQVELMGGRLEVISAPGRGSRFWFTLRLEPAVLAASCTKLVQEIERLAPGHEVRALVVDDIRENREVLSTMLACIGCEIVLAENGRQAIEAVHASRPNIVFMDMRLPEMDGLEATRRIVAEFGPAGMKIVATSASVLDHQRERYMQAGCDDFVAKPFRAERVYLCLARLLQTEFTFKTVPALDAAQPLVDLGSISLPEDLSARLVMAAELHSATVLKNCLKEVEHLGAQGHRLAAHLRGFLGSYDMEMIQRIVAQIPIELAPTHES